MAAFEDQLQVNSTNLKESVNWFGQEIKDLSKGKFKTTSIPEIGKMYLYVYDPKLKQILPFYDMYPLTIPTDFYNDGFLGINLHYLPPMPRLNLLNSLHLVANSVKYNENTKFNITYQVLKHSARQFPGFDQCVKRYLYGHVRSSFSNIHPEDWKKVAMLPLQKWTVNSNSKYASKPPY